MAVNVGGPRRRVVLYELDGQRRPASTQVKGVGRACLHSHGLGCGTLELYYVLTENPAAELGD